MADESSRSCRVCGTPNPPEARTCATCGVAFDRAESIRGVEDLLEDLLEPEVAAPPSKAAQDSLDLDAEIVDELLDSLLIEEPSTGAPGIHVECPLCGHEVAADATRCDNCGSAFEEITLDETASPAAPTVPMGAAILQPSKAPTRVEPEIPVAAAPTETDEKVRTLRTGRLIDLVVGGTCAGLVLSFFGLRLYSWSSIATDPVPLAVFLGIAAAGMVAGIALFRLSTSLLAQGDRLVKAGRYPEAVAYFDRAIRMGHRPSNAWTSKGVAMKRLGRLEEAVRCQQMAVRLDPENEIAWCNLGDLYFRLRDFAKALESYDKAIEIRPRYAIAWNNKGAAFARTDRFEEARACHDRAVKLQPRYVAAWLNRGEVLARLGEREEAQRCLERARALGA